MSASRILGLVVLSSWLVVGCSGDSPKLKVGATCVLNSDCDQPLVCTMGKCHDACHASADCPTGQSCVTTTTGPVCQLPAEADCRTVPCATGFLCAVDLRCHAGCLSATNCTSGQVCVGSVCADPADLDVNGQLPKKSSAGGVDGGTDTQPAAAVDSAPDNAPVLALDGPTTASDLASDAANGICVANGKPALAGTVCRQSRDGCDPAETCDGYSATCPADVFYAPPAVPTGVSATPGTFAVTVGWNSAAGATGYNVSRSTTSGAGYTLLGTAPTTVASPYVDPGVTANATYYYVVTAINTIATCASASSVQVSATPHDSCLPPAAPVVTATAGNGQVSLSWTAPAGAISYNVARSTTPGTGYMSIATVTSGTAYVDSTAANGTTYYYVVTASNGTCNSVSSAETSAAPGCTPPAVPTNLVATAGNNQIALTWTASTGATSYKVSRATVSGGPYTTIATPSSAAYTDTSAANGTTCYYVVASSNGSCTSASSAQAAGTPVAPDAGAPDAVPDTAPDLAPKADGTADLSAGSDAQTPGTTGTVALFHFDGTQGSTVLTDSSGTGKVATITGNPIISTAQSKFGGSSLYINGNSQSATNHVAVDGGTDFTFAGDFTMDWWQYVLGYTDTWGTFVGVVDPADASTCAYCVTASWNSGGAGWHFTSYPGTNIAAPSSNAWHHVALTRLGTSLRAFVDGQAIMTTTSTATIQGLLQMTGTAANSDNGDFNGYIDELRVVKGTAVWTTAFTPPTAPYASTVTPDAGPPDTADASPAVAVPQKQNLMLWLNAATITGLADGATVATWSDGSGNGKDVAKAGVPPTYWANQMNGLPIVRFDGSDDELSTAGNFGLSGDPSYTVVLVAKVSSSNSPSSQPCFWNFGDPSQSGGGACLQWDGTLGLQTGLYQQAYTPAGSFATYADVPSIVTLRRTPGEIGQTTEIFFDGAKQTATGSPSTPLMIDAPFQVGAYPAQRSIMDVAELLAYGIALTDTDRATLECSLGAKYGIALDAALGCK